MATKIQSVPFEAKTPKNDGFPKDKKAIVPKTIPHPVKAYTGNIGRGRAPNLRWEIPEWDLAECGRIIDTESYARRAFKNKKNLFMKEGYDFVGKKHERVAYIKRRIRQIEEATNLPFKILLAQTVSSLVRCSNAFWVKVRKTEASGGKIRTTKTGKKLKPIAGYFIMAPETVRFKRDEYGKLKQYEQHVYGKTAIAFQPEDVIHFYFNKREGYAVGTPDLVSVKDDIRAMRRIEENVELLVYQHLFPLFHYKVGTEKQPAATYANGSTEVDEVALKVATMPSDGCWVTPERHEVKAIVTGQAPVAVEKIIEHFKQRIFTGLGVSSVDMGEGDSSNRSTAQTMSRNLVDDVKADQKEFSDMLQEFVIKELLLESTFSEASLLDDNNMVDFKFKEIDFELQMSKNNHYTDIFLKNGISHNELRLEMGREPFQGQGWPSSGNKKTMLQGKGEGEWANTNYGLIERDKIILQSIDEPGTPESKQMNASVIKTYKAKAAGGGTVSNKNQPKNQYGTRQAAKINKDSFNLKNQPVELASVLSLSPPIQSAFDNLNARVYNQIRARGYSAKEVKFILDAGMSEAKDRFVKMAQRAYRIGLQSTGANVWEVRTDIADGKIEDHINKYVIKLKDDLLNLIKRNMIKNKNLRNVDAEVSRLVFRSLRHRSSMIDNSEIMRSFNYGKASGYKVTASGGGFNIMNKKHSDTECSKCMENGEVLFSIDSGAIIYDELPPFHPNCTCTVWAGK